MTDDMFRKLVTEAYEGAEATLDSGGYDEQVAAAFRLWGSVRYCVRGTTDRS
jgi:hypothetical protein